jgi:hypothetical protein
MHVQMRQVGPGACHRCLANGVNWASTTHGSARVLGGLAAGGRKGRWEVGWRQAAAHLPHVGAVGTTDLEPHPPADIGVDVEQVVEHARPARSSEQHSAWPSVHIARVLLLQGLRCTLLAADRPPQQPCSNGQTDGGSCRCILISHEAKRYSQLHRLAGCAADAGQLMHCAREHTPWAAAASLRRKHRCTWS